MLRFSGSVVAGLWVANIFAHPDEKTCKEKLSTTQYNRTRKMPAATFGNGSGCEIDESTTRCHITVLSPLLKMFSTENDQTQSCVMHTRKPFVGLKISRNL